MSVPMAFRHGWKPLISGVTAGNERAALTTFEYDNAVYVADKFKIPDEWNNVAIAIWGKDAADEDCTVKLYGRMKNNGPIILLYSGEVDLGTKVVTKNPISLATVTGYWADTFAASGAQEFIVDIHLRNETADDDIAYLTFNTYDLEDLYLEVDMDGGVGVAAAEISAIICGSHIHIANT